MPVPHLSPTGVPLYSGGSPIAASVATRAALTALPAGHAARTHGNIVDVDSPAERWMWHSSSALAADDILVDAADDAPTAGRWLRAPGSVDLKLAAIGFGTADAAVVLTMPTGARLIVRRGYWEVGTAFAGGSSSAIGLSGPSPYNTKGDILGGSSGDVEATLTAGTKLGTIGADNAAGIMLAAGDTVKFDRITSVFTSGAGYPHLVAELLANPGA